MRLFNKYLKYLKKSDIKKQVLKALIISLVFLFFHIVIYSSLKKLRQSHPSRNLLCLVCSLFVGQIFFFFGFDIQFSHTVCLFVAIGSHYFLLLSFFCMNVISFDICRTFVSFLPASSSKRRLKLYSYYTWGLPLIIVGCANIIDRQGRLLSLL